MIFRTSMWNFRTKNPDRHRGELICNKICKLHPQLHPQTVQKPFLVVPYEFYSKKITQLTRFATKTWCFHKLFGYAEFWKVNKSEHFIKNVTSNLEEYFLSECANQKVRMRILCFNHVGSILKDIPNSIPFKRGASLSRFH